MSSRLLSLLPLLVPLLGCVSKERALAIVGCDPSPSPLVTDYQASTLGIDRFACIRFLAKSAQSNRLLAAGCVMAREDFASTTYPARFNPMTTPSWWDLREGEPVQYTTLVRNGGEWEGFVYRKASAAGEVWLMCAGTL